MPGLWPQRAVAQSVAPVLGPSRVTDMREMAMIQNSNVYLWIRATDEGTVLVYASSGFRNAFAQPVTLTAEEADRWAAVAAPLMADSLQLTATSRERPDTTSARDEMAFGDFVLITRPHTNPPTLVVNVGVLGPNVVTTTFFSPSLRPLVPAIREAARAAREMAANRAVDSTARAASLAAAMIPSPSVVSPPALAAATPSVAPGAPTDSAPPAVPAVDPRSSLTLAPPAATAPAPNLVQRPVAPLAAVRVRARAATQSGVRATPVSAPTPQTAGTISIVAATATPVAAAPAAAPVAAAPSAQAAPPAAPLVARPPPPVASQPTRETPSASAPLVDPVDGGLSDDEFMTETHRREPAVTACYAQYGLGANPSLSGHFTVRISLSDSGEVMRATVVDRSWNAATPAEVESCVVHKVFVWRFPAARRSSIHDYTMSFGH